MKILIIGNGGREHALAWKTAQSPLVSHVYVATGNGGTAQETNVFNVDIAETDISNLVRFSQKEKIDLTIVGPETPLSMGIVDAFNNAGLNCFGPTQKAAELESSKAFCKRFLEEHYIPTAKYAEFTDTQNALNYLKKQSLPLVIKADGLAAGKGVIIAQDKTEAKNAIENMLSKNQFGEAGHKIIIEDFLEGEEVSYIVISDGKNILPLASSQDHKRRDNGDKGPNTGGMGAYSPAPLLTPELEQIILDKVIQPTIKGMADRGTPYVGFLYAGLIISKDGTPNVLEFNCRLGDPETQPLLMRLKSDLVELCSLALKGKLNQAKTRWDPRVALTVVLASGGYPGKYETGFPIMGLELVSCPNTKVFHAGTKIQNNNIVTNGGRVLAITSLGHNTRDAKASAYQAAEKIKWPNAFYRHDIGDRAIS